MNRHIIKELLAFFVDLCQQLRRIAEFEKVSFEQYLGTIRQNFESSGIKIEDEKLFTDTIRNEYENIKLPKRATSGSAGFDFSIPYDTIIRPGESIKIATGIRAKIEDGWLLAAFPRSSLGFKYRLKLDNTIGIIDSDYYYSSNEGHIMLKMTNEGQKDIHITAGDRIAQGIFLPYGITHSDDATETRSGGFGSTGK